MASSSTSVSRAHRSGKLILLLLWVSFAAVAFNIYSEVHENAFIDHLILLDETAPDGEYDEYDEATLERFEVNEKRQMQALVGYIVALLLSTIFLLVWVSRFNRACRDLGATLRFTPGWAWGYWLIPFLNLVRPFQIVRELWTTTDPEQRSSPLIGVWWAAWLVSGFLARLGSSGNEETLEGLRQANQLLLVSHAFDILGLTLTIVLVTKMAKMLRSYEERVSPVHVRVVSESADDSDS